MRYESKSLVDIKKKKKVDAEYLLNQPFVLEPDVQNVRPPVSFLVCRK